jgi:hypothetical protein
LRSRRRHACTDEFEAGSLDAKWTWRNQGAASVAFNTGALEPSVANTDAKRILYQPYLARHESA